MRARLLLRLRELVLRGFAALLERDAVERLAPADFVRAELAFERAELARPELPADFAALFRAGFRVVVLRAVDLRAADLRAVDFRAVDFRAVDFRALALRAVERRVVLAADGPESSDHLPAITRCAASATASAISEPSFAALDATLLAACCAVSAASRPASRIARRAFGLALIAAAAAARPAASISLLIAAFAILSTVLLPDLDDLEEDFEDFEELLRAAFAIVTLPLPQSKTPKRRNGSLMMNPSRVC